MCIYIYIYVISVSVFCAFQLFFVCKGGWPLALYRRAFVYPQTREVFCVACLSLFLCLSSTTPPPQLFALWVSTATQ